MHRLQEMVRLHREDVGVREIARILEISPNTERKYRQALEDAGLLAGDPADLPELDDLRHALAEQLGETEPPAHERSSIEKFRPEIEAMLDKAGPTAIYDRLRLERPDFQGTLSAVKRMCLRIQREKGPSPKDVVLRVETDPAENAQVDFGYVGRLFDQTSGKIRKAYAFVMVLCFSRLMYVDLVFDQKVHTWIDQHRRAFEYFRGVPRVIVPDNLKAAVLRCYFGFDEKPELNRTYREVARHYEFRVDPTPPRSPHLKGKVESGVKYVKNNFFAPRELETLDEAREQLPLWLEGIANVRVHGTTGRVPREVYDELERQELTSLPPEPYVPIVWKEATVHPDTHVEFERRLYSVPFRLIGESVWVRGQGNTVTIYADDERVATHERRGSRRHTNEAHLPEGRRDLRHRSRDWWQARASQISPVVGEYIEDVFESDDVYSQLRTVQAIVTHLEQYPVDRAEGACRRARAYGNYTFQGIRKILREALDLEPTFPTAVYVHGRLDSPRFARSMDELLGSKEDDHGGA